MASFFKDFYRIALSREIVEARGMSSDPIQIKRGMRPRSPSSRIVFHISMNAIFDGIGAFGCGLPGHVDILAYL
jgi:hypothetical protein